MKKMMSKGKRYFYTGLISLLPIFITIAVFTWLFQIAIKVVRLTFITNMIKKTLHYFYGTNIDATYILIFIYFVSILLMIFFIWIVGYLAKNFLRGVVSTKFNKLISKVPIVRTIYSTSSQIVQIITQNNLSMYKKVVILEYPKENIYSLGFLTSDDNREVKKALNNPENMVNVFIPTSPNPTSGMLVCVPESAIKYLDISVETAFKTIISGGYLTDNKTNNLENVNE